MWRPTAEAATRFRKQVVRAVFAVNSVVHWLGDCISAY